MGIDPGSRICGYGIIERGTTARGKGDYSYVASGRIELTPNDPLPVRLHEIFSALSAIIKEYRPRQAVIERVFFAKSVKAALHLGHARGVSVLAAVSEGIEVYEYSALEVKKALVGYGGAEKRQVEAMVKAILNISKTLSPDSADALALSICHVNTLRFASREREDPRSTTHEKRARIRTPLARDCP